MDFSKTTMILLIANLNIKKKCIQNYKLKLKNNKKREI